MPLFNPSTSVMWVYTVWVLKKEKKRKPRFNSKYQKIKKKIMKLLSVDDSIFIFLSYGTLVFILGQGRLLINHFCKACQHCLRQSFVKVHNAVRMHELLLCCENSSKCHYAAQTMPTWTKQFWHVLHNWLLCSHPKPNMNEKMYQMKVE